LHLKGILKMKRRERGEEGKGRGDIGKKGGRESEDGEGREITFL
jgi:hypothetical protein